MSTASPGRTTSTKKGFFGTGLVRADRILRDLQRSYTFSFETLELQVSSRHTTPLVFPYAQLLMMSEDAFREALTRTATHLPAPDTQPPKAVKKRSSKHLQPD